MTTTSTPAEISARDIEKLLALGYTVRPWNGISGQLSTLWVMEHPEDLDFGREDARRTEVDAWLACKDHSQRDGLKVTMADKIRLIADGFGNEVKLYQMNTPEQGLWRAVTKHHMGVGNSPEAAVDKLFWSVP